ncbi:PREDICTED: pleckstrin homology domain-containing family G member 1-like isoform X2 [Branchiostoma belcheri]|uniref:Pleckstrin homology domain-containing family G member 1-like isoform X2 n=1 Tax=Branchiostoma belcheri TaxID=7741 RepID=A0A6P4YJ68_BRABE|nr:PREDICTED: pleckstrin homology domain-containing family G member 1-like isoform X2 [Branchiostoma belcheri]
MPLIQMHETSCADSFPTDGTVGLQMRDMELCGVVRTDQGELEMEVMHVPMYSRELDPTARMTNQDGGHRSPDSDRPTSISSTSSTSSSSLGSSGRLILAPINLNESSCDEAAKETIDRTPEKVLRKRSAPAIIQMSLPSSTNSSPEEKPIKDKLLRVSMPTGKLNNRISHTDRVVLEIMETERAYVKDLQDIIEGYMGCIVDRPELPITAEDVSSLFGNMEQIYDFNSGLLKNLENCRLRAVKVAECFVEKAKEFHIYTQYCTNYPSAVAVLTECTQNRVMNDFFKERQAVLKHNLPLGAYLLKPVQRVLKYHLLLQDIANNYEGEDGGHSTIKEALDTMTQVAHHINEMKKKHEDMLYVQEIQSQLSGWDGHDLTTYGELLLEGSFRMSRARNERHLYLFEKMLLVTKKLPSGLQCKTHILCSNLMIVESISNQPNSFHVIPFDNPKVQYTFQAKTLEQKRLWTKQLKTLILENLNAVIPTSARKAIMELGNERPYHPAHEERGEKGRTERRDSNKQHEEEEERRRDEGMGNMRHRVGRADSRRLTRAKTDTVLTPMAKLQRGIQLKGMKKPDLTSPRFKRDKSMRGADSSAEGTQSESELTPRKATDQKLLPLQTFSDGEQPPTIQETDEGPVVVRRRSSRKRAGQTPSPIMAHRRSRSVDSLVLDGTKEDVEAFLDVLVKAGRETDLRIECEEDSSNSNGVEVQVPEVVTDRSSGASNNVDSSEQTHNEENSTVCNGHEAITEETISKKQNGVLSGSPVAVQKNKPSGVDSNVARTKKSVAELERGDEASGEDALQTDSDEEGDYDHISPSYRPDMVRPKFNDKDDESLDIWVRRPGMFSSVQNLNTQPRPSNLTLFHQFQRPNSNGMLNFPAKPNRKYSLEEAFEMLHSSASSSSSSQPSSPSKSVSLCNISGNFAASPQRSPSIDSMSAEVERKLSDLEQDQERLSSEAVDTEDIWSDLEAYIDKSIDDCKASKPATPVKIIEAPPKLAKTESNVSPAARGIRSALHNFVRRSPLARARERSDSSSSIGSFGSARRASSSSVFLQEDVIEEHPGSGMAGKHGKNRVYRLAREYSMRVKKRAAAAQTLLKKRNYSEGDALRPAVGKVRSHSFVGSAAVGARIAQHSDPSKVLKRSRSVTQSDGDISYLSGLNRFSSASLNSCDSLLSSAFTSPASSRPLSELSVGDPVRSATSSTSEPTETILKITEDQPEVKTTAQTTENSSKTEEGENSEESKPEAPGEHRNSLFMNNNNKDIPTIVINHKTTPKKAETTHRRPRRSTSTREERSSTSEAVVRLSKRPLSFIERRSLRQGNKMSIAGLDISRSAPNSVTSSPILTSSRTRKISYSEDITQALQGKLEKYGLSAEPRTVVIIEKDKDGKEKVISSPSESKKDPGRRRSYESRQPLWRSLSSSSLNTDAVSTNSIKERTKQYLQSVAPTDQPQAASAPADPAPITEKAFGLVEMNGWVKHVISMFQPDAF